MTRVAGGWAAGRAAFTGGAGAYRAYECRSGCSRPVGCGVRDRRGDGGGAPGPGVSGYRRDHGLGSWSSGPVAGGLEAGPTGFGLARGLAAAGIECVVAAPSKLPRPAGDRVKTDARDALLLARLLRLGEITAVQLPTLEQETARDLVRAREDVLGDLMRARHRLSKLLLRHGV